jgi:two-component system sensor histidine kinase/response regulator
VGGKDELGELARGLNQMAEELQASYGELESRVAQRTEELQRLYEKVKRASEGQAEVFAGISHEFRTPLFAIIGHAELMADPDFRPSGGGWRREFAETIKGSAEALLVLVNDILDLAKSDSGRLKLELEAVRLRDVVDELRSTIVPLARRGELRVELDVPKDLPLVSAAPGRLRQILLNLASNAIKYTPPGGKVRLEARANDGHVEVSVIDTGVGISKADTTRIFEPFYQVKGVHAQGGRASSGLGLALTKRLVEAHSGRIWMRSEPGVGSTFTFSLRTARTTERGRLVARRGRTVAARD